MPKIFVAHAIPLNEEKLIITGEDKKHIRDVLRMKKGDIITVCDSTGTDHICEISSFDESGVVSHILSRTFCENEPPTDIIIFQGLPKADKMDVIIQKCVELGCAAIVPVSCARSVARINDEKDIAKKTQRWNRIAYQAAKQCDRSRIPLIEAPVSFPEAVNRISDADTAFAPWECENDRTIKIFFNENRKSTGFPKTGISNPKPVIAFIVGPEGGFALEEIDLIKQSGIATVSLGKRIMRTETVAPAILAMLLYKDEL